MQSLRSVGYSAASALADLIDNSLAAKSTRISISVAMQPNAYVAIVDDGVGMDEATLIDAMRFGSRDPRQARADRDLGRFGLGLKTASLSQCRRLTVATLQQGASLSIARWDLDECERRGTWWLAKPSEHELPRDAVGLLFQQGHGTLVLWENLDRLEAGGGEAAILEAADHLALTFHRFLSGELVGPFSISLNNRQLESVDPFLAGHTRGQALHAESIVLQGHVVTVSPFVLPFPSRLNSADMTRAGGRESLKTSHGFYVYRGGRLVVPGGWFRIIPSDDLIRLARIRVDIPVSLDHLWKIDIKKAMAEPPPALRPHLRRIVGAVTERSRRVYTHRGHPADERDRVSLWRKFELRDEGAVWRINRDHPVVQSLAAGNAGAESLLALLEQNLPLQDIHIHTVNDHRVAESPVPDEGELESMARQIIGAFHDQPEVRKRILERLPMTEPFNRNVEAANRISQRLRT